MTVKHISEALGHYGENFVPPSQDCEEVQNVQVERDTAQAVGLPNEQGKYTIIFHFITKRFGLTLLESALVSTIHTLSKKYEYCDMGQGTFAGLFGVTTPTIRLALSRLEEMGLVIKSVNKSKYGTNRLKVSVEIKDLIEEIRAQIEFDKNAQQRKE